MVRPATIGEISLFECPRVRAGSGEIKMVNKAIGYPLPLCVLFFLREGYAGYGFYVAIYRCAEYIF